MARQDLSDDPWFSLPAPHPRFRHPVPFRTAALPPDRSVVLGLDAEGVLVGWSVRSRKLLYQVKVADAGGPPLRLTCSPDGRYVAISRRDHVSSLVRVFRMDTGREVRRLDSCFSPCFSPDGEFLAGTDGSRLRRWAVKSGAELPGLEDTKEELKWAAYAPTGDRVAASAACSPAVSVWNLESRSRSFYPGLSGALTMPTSLAFSSDGRTLAIGSFWGIQFLDVTSDRSDRVWGREDYAIGPLRYSPDGRRMAALSQHRRLTIWDVQTGTELIRWSAYRTSEGIMEVSDGLNAVIWVDRDGLRVERIPLPLGGKEEGHEVVSASFTSDGQAITGDRKGEFRVWDPSTETEARRFQGPPEPVKFFALNGRWAVFGGDSDAVRIWDLSAGRELLSVPAVPRVHAIAISPDGRTLGVGHTDGGVSLWEIAEKKAKVRILLEELAGVSALCWSADGRSMAWGDELGSVVLADGRTGGDRAVFKPRGGRGIRDLKFSADGKTVYAEDAEGNCRSYEGDVGKEPAKVGSEMFSRLRSLPSDRRWAESGLAQSLFGSIVYSPDGGYALTVRDGKALIWEAPGEK